VDNTRKIVNTSTFLGVQMSHDLKWKEHTIKLKKRLNTACFGLKILAKELNLLARKTAFYANVQSLIRYGIICWGGGSEALSIFKAQKQAVRTIAKKKKRDSCRKVFKELGILTVTSLYILEVLLFVIDNPETFTMAQKIHDKNTRNKDIRATENVKLKISRQSASYVGAALFNSLPRCLKEAKENRSNFKIRTKRFLIGHCFYNMDEYMNREKCVCEKCT
jgi:hypothetical protein